MKASAIGAPPGQPEPQQEGSRGAEEVEAARWRRRHRVAAVLLRGALDLPAAARSPALASTRRGPGQHRRRSGVRRGPPSPRLCAISRATGLLGRVAGVARAQQCDDAAHLRGGPRRGDVGGELATLTGGIDRDPTDGRGGNIGVLVGHDGAPRATHPAAARHSRRGHPDSRPDRRGHRCRACP